MLTRFRYRPPRRQLLLAVGLTIALTSAVALPKVWPEGSKTASSNTEVVVRSGDLFGDILVWAVKEFLPRGSNRYRIPTEEELTIWRQVIDAMLRGDLSTAASLVSQVAPSFRVVRFTDTAANPERVYYLLLEAVITPDDILPYAETGWGIYVFDPSPVRDLAIGIPHIRYDEYTEDLGIEALVELRPKLLQVFQSHRCSSNTISACGGTFRGCGDTRFHVSDGSHGASPSNPLITNTYEVAGEELFQLSPSTLFVEFHGNASCSAQVVLSNTGNDYYVIPDGNIDRLKQSFDALGFTMQVCDHRPNESVGECDFCGTRNLLGRYFNSNGTTSNPCQNPFPAPRDIERFIHIELNAPVRQERTERQKIIAAIANTTFVHPPGENQVAYVKVTFFGYPDNDDGTGHFGTNVIAHALQWQGRNRHTNAQGNPIAGGIGTFDDPITAAARQGNTLLSPGTLVYIPGLKKYFFVEDICGGCSTEWVDLWMESNAESNADAVIQCEYDWTGDVTRLREIRVNPPAGLEVDTTPFFDTGRDQCNPVTW